MYSMHVHNFQDLYEPKMHPSSHHCTPAGDRQLTIHIPLQIHSRRINGQPWTCWWTLFSGARIHFCSLASGHVDRFQMPMLSRAKLWRSLTNTNIWTCLLMTNWALTTRQKICRKGHHILFILHKLSNSPVDTSLVTHLLHIFLEYNSSQQGVNCKRTV